MARCALLFPSIGLDLAAKLAGAEIAWALDMTGNVIDRMIQTNHKGLPFFGDPSAFPFKLTDADLKCDFWLTANALGTTFALRKVAHRDALPSCVIAQVLSLVELPALIRAWHECGFFDRIEWFSEDARMYGTPCDEKQVYMVGELKAGKSYQFGPPVETPRPRLSKEYLGEKAWLGPAFLDPKAESGEGMSYIQALRRGAVVDAAKAVILRHGAKPADASVGEPFGKVCTESGRTVFAKITDGGIQMLLDNSLEQFHDVWPLNGVYEHNGILSPMTRSYAPPNSGGLPPFTSGTRNSKYILAALGVPYTWIPM
jgi:hypothetical protein